MSTNEILDFFNNEALASAEPNTGRGAWRPAEGEYDVILEDLVLSQETFRYTVPGPGGQKVKKEAPAGGLTFKYRLIEDPESPDGTPRAFSGRTFQIPDGRVRGDSTLPDGQKERIRIQDERLMGHIKTLTGTTPSSAAGVSASIKNIRALLDTARSENRAVAVRLSLRYGEGKTRAGRAYPQFEAEYLVEPIAR